MRFAPVLVFIAMCLGLTMMLLGKLEPRVLKGEKLQMMPVITLTSLDGKSAWEHEHLQGQVTLVNFFASWCGPCLAEMPELAALKKQFPALRIEGVVWNDQPAHIHALWKQLRNPFDMLWLDQKGQAAIGLGIKGIPETFIIDRKGMVRYHLPGAMTATLRNLEIAPLVQELLDEAHEK